MWTAEFRHPRSVARPSTQTALDSARLNDGARCDRISRAFGACRKYATSQAVSLARYLKILDNPENSSTAQRFLGWSACAMKTAANYRYRHIVRTWTSATSRRSAGGFVASTPSGSATRPGHVSSRALCSDGGTTARTATSSQPKARRRAPGSCHPTIRWSCARADTWATRSMFRCRPSSARCMRWTGPSVATRQGRFAWPSTQPTAVRPGSLARHRGRRTVAVRRESASRADRDRQLRKRVRRRYRPTTNSNSVNSYCRATNRPINSGCAC
jgi:hypothetical protein